MQILFHFSMFIPPNVIRHKDSGDIPAAAALRLLAPHCMRVLYVHSPAFMPVFDFVSFRAISSPALDYVPDKERQLRSYLTIFPSASNTCCPVKVYILFPYTKAAARSCLGMGRSIIGRDGVGDFDTDVKECHL